MNLREAKTSLDEFSNALAAQSSILEEDPKGILGDAIRTLSRRAIAKIEIQARESGALVALITQGIAARPHYLESRVNEVLEVDAALQRLKLETDKANEAAERFNKRDSMGEFTIDIEQAKAFRDLEHRFDLFERKRFGPIENRRFTAAEIVEDEELSALITKTADTFVCPPGYRSNDALRDSNRLHQLNCKRMSPRGVLSNAEDEEDARLRVRVAAFWRSPEGRDRVRMRELGLKRIRRRCSADEEKELDRLESLYPRVETPDTKAIDALQAYRKDRESERGADRK